MAAKVGRTGVAHASDTGVSYQEPKDADSLEYSDKQTRLGISITKMRKKQVKRLKTKKPKLMDHFQVSKETIFSTKTLCNASHRSLVGMDTCPNLQLVLKGFRSRLKNKFVLRQ